MLHNCFISIFVPASSAGFSLNRPAWSLRKVATDYSTPEECHDFPAHTKTRCIALFPSVCFDLFLTDGIHSSLSQLICNGQPVLDVNVISTLDDNECIVKLLHLHCANGPCNSESGNNLHNVLCLTALKFLLA